MMLLVKLFLRLPFKNVRKKDTDFTISEQTNTKYLTLEVKFKKAYAQPQYNHRYSDWPKLWVGHRQSP